jgi:DNA repair protein RecO (recombination protein O)
VSRVRLFRSEAIVLKRRDYGEADRILTLYTRDRGKISAIAKGVRRITSRKSGHVELFTHGIMMLAKGRNLDILTQVETIDPHAGIREDLIRTTYAYHIAELVDRFTEEEGEHPEIFDLLAGGLAAISEGEDPSLVTRFFEMRLLGQLGYRPQLFHCSMSGEALEEEGNVFSSEAGGMVSPEHSGGVSDAIPVDPASFRVLRFLQTRDWAMARRIQLTPTTRGTLERVMHAYIRHQLEQDLHSVGFLKGLRHSADMLGLRPVAPEPDVGAEGEGLANSEGTSDDDQGAGPS